MRLFNATYVTAFKRKGRHEYSRIVVDLDAVVALIPHKDTVEVCLGNSDASFRSLESLEWWIENVERHGR